ncbi:MAG: bifunctional folylpolyglutamate synthase/dihydrofolate synthase [Clostridia bacterium]|nr:bifunctional folylpolyglutamate synthase/dihydrofolate synthase [Clostridia bacterium]NCC42852.1 bifunctional folylpolyglutamate synthase/dihydrofolate synthase [Clostridia bacterium]
MLNYKEIVDYIEEIPKFTSKNPLDHTKELLGRLGNPQNQMKVIHVAGTNGKGSVCAYLDSMLRMGGYHVGLFTSPHLVKINERFKIDGEMVSDETFIDAFSKVKKIICEAQAEGLDHPSYFETLFLMCMVIFQAADVDYVILETGLGGRLDATNTVDKPLACIITSISMDHIEYLGDTIGQIAGEKAGIIKPGVPVIYDGHNQEVSKVIEKRAKELGSPAYALTEDMYEMIKNTREGIDFSFHYQYDNIISIPYIASYQMMNASLAFFTMEMLKTEHGIEDEQLIKGIANTRWEGRMETILPGVIVDGAHNADGVERFVETACHFRKDNQITLLFSAVSDKDYQSMIRTISEKIRPHAVVATQIWGSRVIPAGQLAQLFKENGCVQVETEPDVGKAFEKACQLKGDGMLFCVGSLYLVGEIKEYLLQRTGRDTNKERIHD